jgi:mono/diheme cytochrome c family protein
LSYDNQVAVGREIFRVECSSCHTPNAYRGIHQYLRRRQWDDNTIKAMMGGLYMMHNGVMPPFAGTDAERDALAAYIGTLQTAHETGSLDGKTVYVHDCAMCHQMLAGDHMFSNMPKDKKAAVDALKDLPGLFPVMPDLKLNEQQRAALVDWVDAVRPTLPPGPAAAPAQGGK